MNIFLPTSLNICFSAQKNRLIETVLLGSHNVCFGCEIRFFYTLSSKGLIREIRCSCIRGPFWPNSEAKRCFALIYADRFIGYSKTCVNRPPSKRPKNWFQNQLSFNEGQKYFRMLLSTFIQLPFVIKIFVLSIFEWPFYTGFTVQLNMKLLVLFDFYCYYTQK